MGIFRKHTQSEGVPSRRSARHTKNDDSLTSAPSAFRRGRTLTGSSSSSISSSTELSADILSPRAKSHHLSKRQRRLSWYLVGVIVLCLVIYIVLGQLIARVSLSSTAALAFVNQERQSSYIDTLNKYLDSRPVERFAPSLNERTMLQFLQAEHPEIERASLELLSTFGEAQLDVELRTPIAKWSQAASSQYVDTSGTVFDFDTPPEDVMVEIVDKSGISPSSDVTVASKRFLGFVGVVSGKMSERGYVVTKATLPILTTRQLEISIRGVRYPFKLTIDRSAGEQVEDIDRIVQYMKKSSISPDYVDVRIKGKAYFR